MNSFKKAYYLFLKIKNRLFSGRPVLVLMYHHVHDASEDLLRHLSVSVSDFEKQLLYFKSHFEVTRLEEDWRSLNKTGIVLTFDDGYVDNLKNALPLLEKYDIPATFFITTENIVTSEPFWWDRLAYDYSKIGNSFLLPDLTEVSKTEFTFKKLNSILSALNNAEKVIWLAAFEKANHVFFINNGHNRLMTFEELRKLSEHPLISIGLHSHSHYQMGEMSFENQKSDIELNRKILNDQGIKTIDYIAMPHGSYNRDTALVVAQLGLKGMLLANNYYSNEANKKTGRIFRILMPSVSEKALEAYLGRFDCK
jgi:peptidoglycan/xylan/chitin deacetylase (PgdA/CDA1 family)